MFHQKHLCTRCDAWAGVSWWSCQSPVAHIYGLLNHLNSFCRGMFKLNAKSDADLLPYSLNHFEHNGHTVHMLTQQCLLPHWLVQWSHHCSLMCIPVHSPWLPGSIISHKQFIILTMAGLFPDRPHHITIWKMGMTSTRNSTEFTGQNGGFWRNIKYMHNLAFVY